jgi:hypothetical protein
LIEIPFIRATLAFGLACALLTPAAAQDAKPGETAKTKQEEPKRDPKTVEYEKAVKDLKLLSGSMPIYIRNKEILLELPEDKLNQVFLMQVALSSGGNGQGLQAGDPIGTNAVDAFRWEKHEEKIWLVRPNFRYRWRKDDPFSLAAGRSFPEAVLGSFSIEQTDPEKKKYLVNITSLFTGDLLRLSELVNIITNGQFMLDRDKSGIARAKGFPDNTVVQMRQYYYSPRPAEGNPIMELLGFGGLQLEDGRGE